MRGRNRSLLRLAIMAFLLPFLMGADILQGQERNPAPPQKAFLSTKAKTPASALEPREHIPDWMARWELARVLSYMKRYDESLGEYRKLFREKSDLWEARVEYASVLYWSGEPEEALKELEQIPIAKTDIKTRLLMADLYTAQKNYEKAESLYRLHLAKNPGDLKVRLRLADILGWGKRYSDSLAEYEKVLEEVPQDHQVRRKYALILIWSGRHADGARELKKTLP